MDLELFNAKTTSDILIGLRTERGWTQAVAAEHCGLSRSAYMQIESGWTEHPHRTTLGKIAAAYGISDKALLGQPIDSGCIAAKIDEVIRILTDIKSTLT